MKNTYFTTILLGFYLFSTLKAQLPVENSFYKINPTHSNHFLSVSANMFKNGTQIILWENPPGTCEDGQAYKFEKVNDFYKITARNKFGKCLTVKENKQGSIVIIDDFRNADNQLWKVEDLGGIYSIISKQNNFSLNISGANPNNGADVIVWPFTASSNDRFRLIPAEDETPYWENLGPEVNTSQSDYAPCFSPDGKTLFFSRGDTKGRYIYNSKVYMATQKPDGTFGNVKRMPEFDFEGNGRVVSFLPGGNQIVIFGDFTGGDDMFSIVEKTEYGWSKPKPMGIKRPNIKYNTWTGVMASDGRTFIIEMNLTDRNDESDMYVSFKGEDGKWSTPKYMGDVINKPYIWDGTPYLSPDMTTLYFNSNRVGNSGTEIYMSKRLDDTWTNWTELVEIDKGIYIYSVVQNYSVPGNGEYAYFVSGMKTFGEGDIFRMKIENKLKPEPFMIINGKTLNSKDNSPVQSDIVFENLETGKRVGRLTSNPLTGEFQLALPKGKNYGIFASAVGYFSISENLDLKSLSEFETIERNLLLTPVSKGETIRINNVFFDFAKATLQPESYPELDRVVEMLKLNNNFTIEIRGHTDNVGGEANNQTLSENRAQSVKNYIISKGIDESRVKSVGFGENKPVSNNTSEKGRQENRRVEFIVL